MNADGPEGRTPAGAQADDDAARADGESSADPLEAARVELDGVLDLPVTERSDVFERTHRLVLAELRAIEPG